MAGTDNPKTESVTFVCEKCGECCRNIGNLVSLWSYQTNGVCIFLRGDLCSIYENRPDLCDYKRAYKHLKKYMTETEYYEKIIYYCKHLKELKSIRNRTIEYV
jgi:Fe-S-cluster containining protein